MSKLISFQGELGANSHTACSEARPDWEALPCPTFEDAFAAVNEGPAGLAMIPIENSIAGRVADIHHLLPTSGLHIVGEHFLPIHFNLMAPKGATLKTVKSVESHIHALGQCRRFIRKHNYKAVIAADTAGAARHISETDDVTRAALAPRLAAKIYGLTVLAENVEDEDHNTTRFVVLSREEKHARANSGLVVTT
ncbi:MAG: prephenate dehydratase domain-containing protein, partial [Microvirga sp.]